MHPYAKYFPVRSEDDELDVAPLLYRGLATGGERIFMHFEGEPISVTHMSAQVAAFQRWLAANGMQRGDRVALMLENSTAHIALIYALILSGIVWVPVNTRLKSAGVAYLAGHCKPRLFITQHVFREAVRELAADSMRIVFLEAIDTASGEAALSRVPTVPADTLCLIYTSGTTGTPKAVMFTGRMLRIASESALMVADARDGDRLFLWEPLCHIGGAQMLLGPFLKQVQLHVVTRFSASRFWTQALRGRVTQLHYLGGILDILMQLPPEQQPPHHEIRAAWGAGVSAQAWNPIRERMGFALRECYGLTEGSSFSTANFSGKPGSIGRPLPWLTLELFGDNERPVPCGEIGQIVLSSAIEGTFMPMYLDNPKATRAALKNDKLCTGDTARMDVDGDLFFVGRRSDSMRVRGENVSAWEIERIFALHPAVAACAAVGVDSAIGEQEILLYVGFKQEQPTGFQELADWAAEKLATYQLPRYFVRVDRFETTPSERIRKHLLPRTPASAWDRLRSEDNRGNI